jgi:hypothetical protein
MEIGSVWEVGSEVIYKAKARNWKGYIEHAFASITILFT